MDNTFNYSLESKKVVARCNDSINIFVNLLTTKVLDITDENNNNDVFSSNLITEHYKISTDNIVIFYNNIVEMSMVD